MSNPAHQVVGKTKAKPVFLQVFVNLRPLIVVTDGATILLRRASSNNSIVLAFQM
jgi:hypothetical protein